MMKPSEIIKKIRNEVGLTQEEFAHAISSTMTTVNRWENDKSTPNRMAKALLIAFCENKKLDKALIEALQAIR